jgi:alanyl-tRNA synthetase
MNKEGIVLHYGTWEKTQAPLGATATLLIDKEKRLLHTYLHAAGHLIDIALHSLGHQLPSAASYHFPDNPYVEYMGALPSDPTLMTRLQEKVFELQEAHLPVYTQIYTEEEAEKLGLHAPIGKEVRVVQYGTHAGVGCGGTHVANTSALPPIYIRKISHKRGCTKVQYIVYGKSNA